MFYENKTTAKSEDLVSFSAGLGMSLDDCTYAQALQLLGMACGKTFKIAKGIYETLNFSKPQTDIRFIEISQKLDNVNDTDYVISPLSSYSFPEITKEKSQGN